MKVKSYFLAIAVALTASSSQAAAPDGYYNKCENKGGQALLSALNSTIANHHNVDYDGLWNVYKTSDVRDDGTLWDIYSTKAWPSNFTKCGNYKSVGDCVNREHSFPKSWWGGSKNETYSDAFHLYPTDGYVNNQRSNYAYGECANGKQVAANGNVKPLGRLGTSTFSGFSGTVFEPDDEYKGDVARSYFYLAACYNKQISGWTSGNGKDMLAGNSYPVFKSWAIELLLKWHRQDPVSPKEKTRNDAIYAHQNNRNPFIDHPEMVEYIWGDKKTENWTSSGPSAPLLIVPVNGSTLDLGSTLAGVSRTATLEVRGANLTENVSLSISGSGFTVSPATITKSAANSSDGAKVSVTFNPSAAGVYTATLSATSGSLTNRVTLRGEAYTTIPAGPVKAVSAESFTAVWSYVGDADASGNYTLDVRSGGSSVAGYPRSVKASDEYFTVNDLEPLTTYSYTVASRTLKSAEVQVTTTAPVPRVDLLYDDDPMIYAIAGEPSAAAEILMDADYIDSDINLSVEAPFQLSSDKSNWVTSLTLNTEVDHFYLRVFSEKSGNFFTSIIITAGDYHNDDVDFNAVVSSPATGFIEDFERDDQEDHSYSTHTYQGSMCDWEASDAGVWSSDKGHTGQAMRMGSTAASKIEMLEDYASGMGIVTVWATQWTAKEGAVAYTLEYSTDGGQNWRSAGDANVSSTDWVKNTFTVNSAGPTRLRIRQTSGKRFLLDDIEATTYSGISDAEVADYHTWDAFCRDGKIVVELQRDDAFVRVYALDGTQIFAATVACGTTEIEAASGLYIVAVDDYARRVVIP